MAVPVVSVKPTSTAVVRTDPSSASAQSVAKDPGSGGSPATGDTLTRTVPENPSRSFRSARVAVPTSTGSGGSGTAAGAGTDAAAAGGSGSARSVRKAQPDVARTTAAAEDSRAGRRVITGGACQNRVRRGTSRAGVRCEGWGRVGSAQPGSGTGPRCGPEDRAVILTCAWRSRRARTAAARGPARRGRAAPPTAPGPRRRRAPGPGPARAARRRG
jgi:hypothetical protein